MEIACRSPQEINDARIVDAHTDVCYLLNLRCNGVLLYRGKSAIALQALRDKLEQAILTGGPCPDYIEVSILRATTL